MKKSLILVIVILNLFTQTVSSKEIRSMFGFYLDLPRDYEPVQNLNLNQFNNIILQNFATINRR